MVHDTDASNDAVQKATGRGWDDWFQALDALGGDDHTQRARRLAEAHPDLSGWWCQSITVEYERARGLRARHETARGFQVSAQRTLAMDADAAWASLAQGDWMPGARWEDEATFPAGGGASVTVRAVRPPTLLRFWLHEASGRSTVTVDLSPRARGTTVRFQSSGLPSAEAVETTRTRWKRALDALSGTPAKRR